MKLTILFITICFLQVSAATYAQKITLSDQNISLVKALESIHKQSGYALFYDNTLVKQAGNTSVDIKDASVEDALREVLKNQPFNYTIIDKTIVVKEKESTIIDKIKKALTPPTDIIGRVTNTHGQPLNGATVAIKRTQTGTLTDANGNFTVRGVLPTDTLVFSYLGYKRAFVRVGEQKDLKIVLEEATNQLDQVVIQAYGETSQRLTTGDIGKVTAAQIEKQPVMNVIQALQGQIPGLVISQTNGYASAPFKVEIRGRNSINNSITSDPLYIIDGVPLTVLEINGNTSYAGGSPGFLQSGYAGPTQGQSPFFSINPSDIQSIEVLKDADATAIYGSRGANGVILITTKSGKSGKTKFDLSVNQGTKEATRFYQLLNTQQYLEMRQEAFKNDGFSPDPNSDADVTTWNKNSYTDWQKFLWGGIGHTTDVHTSLSGGDDRTTFRIGAAYNRETTILTVSGAEQRGSIDLDLKHSTLNRKFTIDFKNAFSYAVTDVIPVGAGINLPPDAPGVYDSNGNLNYKGWEPFQYYYPFGNLLQPYNAATTFLNSSLLLKYELFKGLNLSTTLGYNYAEANQTFLKTIASQDPTSGPLGYSIFNYNFNHNVLFEPKIEYNTIIGKGKLNVLLGGSSQSTHTKGVENSGNGYTSDVFLRSITNAPSTFDSDNDGQYKYAAVFGRINYNWEDKYIINLNGRRDGSSRFGPGKQFGNFGSIGAAWLFTSEKWVSDNLQFLSFGKLRGSYGVTGSDAVGDYAYLTRWSGSPITYNGISPLYPTQHADSLFQWEVNRKTEFALDLGFLKDNINLEIAWYRNRCNNQLVNYPTPYLTGFGTVVANSPADVQNTGLEFTLNTKIVKSNAFSWVSNFNISFNRNKLLAFPNLAQSPYANTLVVGQSINIRKLLHSTGVDPLTGQYSFEDKNHDGQITINYNGTPDDRYTIDMSPKFSGGWTNNFSYKNIDLSFSFYFVKQTGRNALQSPNYPGTFSNQPVEVLQRWQKPGDITDVARFTTTGNVSDYNFHFNSDGVYTDASFIRLSNLSISYTFAQNILQKLHVSGLRIYAQGQNLLLITAYKGADPETQNFGLLPPARVLTGGIQLTL